MVDDPAIRPVAIEARERLERAIAGLKPMAGQPGQGSGAGARI
jgi:hypothetical protein